MVVVCVVSSARGLDVLPSSRLCSPPPGDSPSTSRKLGHIRVHKGTPMQKAAS